MSHLRLIPTHSSETGSISGPNGRATQRLTRAVIGMSAVLDRQRREVQVFQDQIEDLDAAVAGLHQAIKRYQEELAAISTLRLQRKARRLARIMDGYLVNQT